MLTDEDIDDFKRNPEETGLENAESGSPEDNLKCNICAKYFKTKHGLNIHCGKLHSSNIHANTGKNSQETFFKCDVCGFTFTDQKNLNNHLEQCLKSFKCETCGKCFDSEVNLNEHLQSHNEDDKLEKSKSFQCEYCDVEIVAENNLQGLKDMETHHKVCLCKPKVNTDLPCRNKLR